MHSPCLFSRFLIAFLLSLGTLLPNAGKAQFCNGAGNVVVFSNYDGSGNTVATRLNINVDVNIPNLKIGISSYERVTVNIAGTQVACVTAVRWAGYGATNNHCTSTAATVITGVAPGIITYVTNPPATVTDPLGNTSIIGGYACTLPNGTGNGGGSASMYQIVNYFLSAFGPGSTLRSAFSQYGCWAGTTKTLSAAASGNCCPLIAGVLPVELLSMQQNCEENKNVLEWATASEAENDFFTIESSSDGISFERVDEVKGAGNSTDIRSYRWTDENSTAGKRYYRLSQTSTSGETHTWEPLRVTSCSEQDDRLTLLGTPGENALTIQFRGESDEEPVDLVICDAFGKQIKILNKTAMNGVNIYITDMSDLAPGTYLVMAKGAWGSEAERFVRF